MDLPVFRYHPDPIASGSIVASEAQCVCCAQRRGFIYAGPSYCEAELDDALCPWCIADGSAHEKFGASFVDDATFPDEISPEIIEEITFRTPSFSGWQQEKWLSCCGDAATFIESAGHSEIRERHPQLEAKLTMEIMRDLGIPGAAAARIVTSLDRDHGPTAYVFSCRHCGSELAYIDNH